MRQSFASAMRRARVFAVAILLLSALPVRAQSSTPAPASLAPPAMREVVDEAGRTVRVPQLPSRIVSLAPSLTETLYALGLQDRLVGDTDFCDYPPDAQKKRKVGGIINPNLEEIAALHPDLVLVTKEINRLETVRALDALGIPAYATHARNVDDILSSTQKLADLLASPKLVSPSLPTFRLASPHYTPGSKRFRPVAFSSSSGRDRSSLSGKIPSSLTRFAKPMPPASWMRPKTGRR